jgi:tRNA pseudouridine32 synthase / 23S rRNA pseudouridine746 synthase
MSSLSKESVRERCEPPPSVEGVGPSRRRLPAGRWKTVLEFLSEEFARIGAATWRERMARGLVLDESGAPLTHESPYRAGSCVYYYREPSGEESIPFRERVLYADAHLLVADKPHFLPVAPAGRYSRETLLARLRRKTGLEHLTPVHRIDRETAGLVLFSVNPSTRDAYASLFRERRVVKVYEAFAPKPEGLKLPLTRRSRIVAGEPFFCMKESVGEPNSETRVEMLEESRGAALYRLTPLTGRKHQLRLHMAALGAPIFNDRLYPEVRPETQGDFSDPLMLLAKAVAFFDPLTQSERRFESVQRLDLEAREGRRRASSS